jgi:Ca-activated chloride channel homolog
MQRRGGQDASNGLARQEFDRMPMKSLRKTALLALTLAIAAASPILRIRGQNPPPPAKPSSGQQAPASQQPQQPVPTIRTTTREVVVPVTVKDRHRNLVAGLNKDDFRIFEDNVEQQILVFSAEAFPLSMVVLIDNDLGQKDQQQVEPSLVSILAGLSTADEASINRFDQFFHEGKGFTKEQDTLLTELQRTVLSSRSSTPPSGDPFSGPTINNAPAPGLPPVDTQSLRAIKGQPTKTLDDAVYNAAMQLKDRDSRKRRKIILLISDGQNGAKFNNHTYEETRGELLRQGIAVYSVATGSQYFNRKFTRLSEYSHDTGGEIFYGAKQDSFSEFYSLIAEQARNQYTLVYSPHGESEKEFHSIEVRVRREGLTIITRQGYYSGAYVGKQR